MNLEAPHSYYMLVAATIRENAKCIKRKVGSLVVLQNRVLSAGYNGTPEGVPDCTEGGCARCNDKTVEPGQFYDLCLCVHAEENALITGARFGTGLAGGTLYTTLEPCFICMRELAQAEINQVFYWKAWDPPAPPGIAWVAEMKASLRSKFRRYEQVFPMKPSLLIADGVCN